MQRTNHYCVLYTYVFLKINFYKMFNLIEINIRATYKQQK